MDVEAEAVLFLVQWRGVQLVLPVGQREEPWSGIQGRVPKQARQEAQRPALPMMRSALANESWAVSPYAAFSFFAA